MPSKVVPIPQKPKRRKKCRFCTLPMIATTVCDFGWSEITELLSKPCNAPICPKHTQVVVQDDGKHIKEYCPKHRQEIAKVANADS